MAVPSSLAEREIPSRSAPQSDPAQHLLQFSTGYISTSALWVAAELKIADLIGAGSKPVSELANSASATTPDFASRYSTVTTTSHLTLM